jgi:hypothetical protein
MMLLLCMQCKYYEDNNKCFDLYYFCNPHLPRSQDDFDTLIQSYDDEVEMVVSVKAEKRTLF